MRSNVVKGLPLLLALVAVAALGVDKPAPIHASAVRPQHQDALATPQRFRAVAQNLTGRGPAGQFVEIDIEHWSTEAQRDQLLDVLRSKGEQAMLDVLQKLPVVGTIHTPDTLAYDLHFARSQPWDDGGEQVLIATDRWISYWEAAHATRSLQYPFTVIQLRMKGNGEGEGRLSVATKVIAAGREIVLENYDTQPVMLTEVTRERP